MPSYKLKKEKQDKSVTTSKELLFSVTLSPTLVDPAHVSVLRTVDRQYVGLSAQLAEKKKKVEEKKSVKSKSSTSSSRQAPVSTDQRFKELDQKWWDQFNWLEALLLAKTLDRQQELTFNTVEVAPTHSPPVNVIRSTALHQANRPTIKLTDLLYLQQRTHWLPSIRLTDLIPWTDQQPLIGLPLVILTQTVLYPTVRL